MLFSVLIPLTENLRSFGITGLFAILHSMTSAFVLSCSDDAEHSSAASQGDFGWMGLISHSILFFAIAKIHW